MAAGAGMQLAHDGVAVEAHARLQGRWQRQRRLVGQQLIGRLGRQCSHPRQLQGQVVGAAAVQGQQHQGSGCGVEVGAMRRQRGVHGGSVQVVVHAVGGQQVELAGIDRPVLVVDLECRAHAQGLAEVALGFRQPHPVVFGQLLQCLRVQPVDAGVPHVQQVRLAALEDQRAEGAHMAAVLVEAAFATLGLGVQPRVGGLQHALRGAAHGPGLGREVVVLQKTAHRGGAGHLADRAAADAVGQRQHHTFGGQQGILGHHRAVEVLVQRLAARLGVLADVDAQSSSHCAVVLGWVLAGSFRPGAWVPACSAWSTASRPRRSGHPPGCPAPWESRSTACSP